MNENRPVTTTAMVKLGPTAPLMRPEASDGGAWATLVAQAETALESGFLPRAIQKPAQAIAIAMAGRELGLPPMASFRLLSIIEGKPVLAAEGLLGLVYKHVKGARVDVIESTDQRAVVEAQRAGGAAARFTFSMADAQRAGLARKDNWSKYPATMCRWRAIMNACRAIFPDATLGIVLPDEAEEIAAARVSGEREMLVGRVVVGGTDGADDERSPAIATGGGGAPQAAEDAAPVWTATFNRLQAGIDNAATPEALHAAGVDIGGTAQKAALPGDALKELRAGYAARKKALATAPKASPRAIADTPEARRDVKEAVERQRQGPAAETPGPAWAHGPPGPDPDAEPTEREPGED